MIIVTGGAGFIGSALVWELNRRGNQDILIVDRLHRDQRWLNLRALAFADFVDQDEFIDDIRKRRFPGKIDTILHLGACSDTTEQDAGFLLENNYRYTKSLIEYACETDVRLIYASSAATYGDGGQGYDDNESLLPKLRPLNMYGYSKQMADLWAWRSGALNKVAGVKYSNVFGPNEYHKGDMRSMIHKAYEQIRDEGKVRLFKSHRPDYADGEQVRDFIYIKDAVNMTLAIADRPEINGIFNVGSGRARSWNDLGKAVSKAMNCKTEIEYIDMPKELRSRYQYHTCLSMDKSRGLGLEGATYTLEQGIEEYVRGYLQPGVHLGDE